MARTELVAFRVAEEEHRVLLSLAVALERNISDTIRYLLREAARARGLMDEPSCVPAAPAGPYASKGQGP